MLDAIGFAYCIQARAKGAALNAPTKENAMASLKYKFDGERDDCLMLLNNDGLTDLHDIAVLYETGLGMISLLEGSDEEIEREENKFSNLNRILRELREETERLTKRRR